MIRAFVDEAGDRGLRQGKSSDHFVMSAVLWRPHNDTVVHEAMTKLKTEVNRQPHQRLHFTKLNHYQRLQAAQSLGALGARGPLQTITVAVRKFDIDSRPPEWNQDMAYLWTYRLLLERMSWLAKSHREELDITIAHVFRFETKKLREYEAILRSAETAIYWPSVPSGARMINAADDTRLDWADIAASSAFHALEHDPRNGGFSEWRYLKKLSDSLWRYQLKTGKQKVLSYGFKLVPSQIDATPYEWCKQI